MRGRIFGPLAITIALSAMTAGGIVIAQQGGAAGTANIWVDATGGSCTDNASPIEYPNDGTECSWDAANDTCDEGDTVGVMGGSYGDVDITGSNGRNSTPVCTFEVADGETVTLGTLENGHWEEDTGGDWLTFVGPVTAQELFNDQTASVMFDDWTIDGQFVDDGASAQLIHFQNTDGTFKNGEVKNSCANTGNGAMIWVDRMGGTITFDNNLIHDAHNCDPAPGDPHTECMYLQGPDNVTLTRNVFHHCATMDVFVTGEDTANNLYIENNVFGRPCGDNENPHVCETPLGVAFKFRSGGGGPGDPAPAMVDSTIRHNTFRGSFAPDNGASGTNVVKGNIFMDGAGCPSNTTYSYNAHTSGSCGGTGSFNDATLTSDFVDGDDYAADGGDWTPINGGGMHNVGNTGDYPALDLLGASRYDGSAPDIGAVERQE